MGDIQKANNDYFDEKASSWDQRPEILDVADQVAKAIRETLSLDAKQATLLDFGCGTGNVSFALCPYIKSALGIDASNKMVEIFNQKAKLRNLEAFASIAVDIATEQGYQKLKELNQKFDIIQSTSVFHHISDLNLVVARLATLLSANGSLLVVEMEPADALAFHDRAHRCIAHKEGFREDDMKELGKAGGLTLVAFKRRAVWFPRLTRDGEGHGHHPQLNAPEEPRKFPAFLAVLKKV
ncbi:hypothetical protein SeMB42_g01501 [Synchytrium endobioticum]|uniref:Methyltransferase domain-containing protein n=1 Tax=Synchytrium endobioticum TaxID=286115 RepID=A0A507DKS5_9FUNG|nr:hypothetical protein SeLEV6574_g01976 [Synchytrium endobioticum]TPX52309.1 hypothetical protein SeMB42_g01501 [Synchytrium endobioticum]